MRRFSERKDAQEKVATVAVKMLRWVKKRVIVTNFVDGGDNERYRQLWFDYGGEVKVGRRQCLECRAAVHCIMRCH